MVWKKGQSGNPAGGGHTRKQRQIAELLAPYVPEAIEVILKELRGSGRMAAAKEIIDRVYGKPAQALSVSGPNDTPLRLQFIDGPPNETREEWVKRQNEKLNVGTTTGTTS